MGKTCLLFPGFGSQYSGMAKAIIEENSGNLEKIIDRASDYLNIDVFDMICNPENDSMLKSSVATAMSLFVTSALYFELLLERRISFDLLAGHSFGEYSLLYAANMLGLEDGLDLVRHWAEFTQSSSDEVCSVIAVNGLSAVKVDELMKGYNDIWISETNSNYQVVVAGSEGQVGKLSKDLQNAGAMGVVKLNLKVAYHTPYMQKAREKLGVLMSKMKFKEPNCYVVTSKHSKPTKNIEPIIESLLYQTDNRISLVDIVRSLVELGVSKAYEVGPGRALKGLTQTITSKIKFQAIV